MILIWIALGLCSLLACSAIVLSSRHQEREGEIEMRQRETSKSQGGFDYFKRVREQEEETRVRNRASIHTESFGDEHEHPVTTDHPMFDIVWIGNQRVDTRTGEVIETPEDEVIEEQHPGASSYYESLREEELRQYLHPEDYELERDPYFFFSKDAPGQLEIPVNSSPPPIAVVYIR